ncbi:MAG TPA: TolC family protein, partial [Noviherbaspirillum sp.]|nr:TolC family protein [Noviherbaspirillum sp.]
MNAPYPGVHRLRPLAAAASALFLAGCATFSADGGLNDVSSMTAARVGQPVQFTKDEKPARPQSVETRQAVSRLLAEPLSPESAVQVALLNNPGLRTSLSELGVAEADLVQAGQMRNPGFTFGRMRDGADVEIERSIGFDVIGLLTIPLRRGIEAQRFEQAKAQAAAEAVRIAAQTRRAWFNAVAAAQTVEYMEQVGSAAEASAELARRMAAVGNWSRLDHAREQVFYAEATAQIARARHHARASREQLARMMGLWGDQLDFRLPNRLPDLPQAPRGIEDFERIAMEQRLDLQMARRDAEATARALGLSRRTGFINVLHAELANVSETGGHRARGYEIELALPIFDWGQARNARAEAIYMGAVHRTADVAVRARSEVREAYSAYRTSYDLARHYRDEVVPLRRLISEEMVLRYNGMLVGVFELLADARVQVAAVNSAIEAQRDYWLAQSDLHMALHGTGGAA